MIDSILLAYIKIYRHLSFTVLDDVTIRGCSPVQTEVSINENNHQTCENDRCNGDIFPEDRLHCLHCAGSSCVNQADTIDVRHPCVNYDGNDKCYSIFSPGILIL